MVKITVGVGGAVCGDQKVCAVKVRRIYRSQPDLDRPVGEFALWSRRFGRCSGRAVFQMKLYCFGVISCGLPLFKGDGSGRTGRQAVTQSVAVVIPDQSGDDPGRKERGVQ